MLNHVAYLVKSERFLVQFLARAVRRYGNAGARVAVNHFGIHGVCECLGKGGQILGHRLLAHLFTASCHEALDVRLGDQA